jgi:hypothetical protein
MTIIIFLKWWVICSVAAAIILIGIGMYDRWKYGDLTDPDEKELD